MHLLLTDRLTCPRCGPGFGLILLAKRLEERRVLEGSLGCPNCRDRFPIEGGFADLRPPPRDRLGTPPAPAPPPSVEAADRLAALMGPLEGPGNVALVGEIWAHAARLADRLPDIEVVALDAAARAGAETERVSRMMAGPELPFQPWTFRALALAGGAVALEEAVRVVARGGRVVVERAPPDARARLEALRARILLDEGGWIVALRETS